MQILIDFICEPDAFDNAIFLAPPWLEYKIKDIYRWAGVMEVNGVTEAVSLLRENVPGVIIISASAFVGLLPKLQSTYDIEIGQGK